VNRPGRYRYLRLAQLVWRLPTYTRVIWGMFLDRRTPLYLKALLAGGLVYLLTPLDLVPDAIPIIGQADDLTVLLMVIDIFLANAPAEVRVEHWERARSGRARLDEDLARLRELLGDRYDQIRDTLPDLLERYGDLREPATLRGALVRWRSQREASGEPARDQQPATSGSAAH